MRVTRHLVTAGAALALASGGLMFGASSASAESLCNYISDSSRPYVYPDDEGAAVKQVQCLINNYSDYPEWLTVDGDYGNATYRAVTYVQRCNGTTGGADGIVGPSTWYRLYTPKASCAI
ncbi:peptidoglycan-binding domain-containing protein [Streptomyces sp. NPDC006134]|uniref:peptidoglycan-binding domain-containing protein n=1 Tax=Streptomyces sp. NPDC006134 TaxID=3154467 RepID=UPI0034067C1A